ncbi:hypothetical protein N7468_008684 [Penicillium chermesinum]|uniref:HCNGP-like protein n=1 Tax=Penicillium chermesinum TaxID=63820 RepID=A0A9W9NQ69_9EURO|nr:uncharacterized protein N7468_008684 [Penicillium chermesinum]KAJ5224142.1 hypothetical protein N7468_008684 [Penicillium chermesinum]
MLGLDAYESSSEDEVQIQKPSPESEKQPLKEDTQPQRIAPTPLKDPRSSLSSEAAPSGPVLGPVSMDSQTPSDRSPYSTSRALVHDLTLPPVPNLDIPPSPPGSPDPAANAKFQHFLSLKHQGVHFNAKLATSSSLKNPSLLRKMMQHSGIEEQAQHETSLPGDLWDTYAFPRWGFKDELLKTQQEIRNKIEARRNNEQRSSIQFVSASNDKPKSSV